MPSNPPHHRSGAALYYIISGTGANTVDGKTEAKGPGSLIYEPFGLVHQWGNPGDEPLTFLAMIGKAETALEAFVPEEINDCAGKHLDLQIGPRRLAFTSETFILSFSLPNFHFHAVTAYNILRSRGVPLGKLDYEGRLRTSSF